MKVKFTENSKKIFTVSEMPMVRKVITAVQSDETSLEEYARQTMRLFSLSDFEIYKPVAEVCKNHRLFETDRHNLYTDDSWDTDIWITFLAFNSYEGAYDIGIYLSDIWSIPADSDQNIIDEIKGNMYINSFTRKD